MTDFAQQRHEAENRLAALRRQAGAAHPDPVSGSAHPPRARPCMGMAAEA